MTRSATSRAGKSRHSVVMTPMGSGLFSLFFPGVMVAALIDQPSLLAVGIGAGLLLSTNLLLARVAVARIGLRVRAPSVATIGNEAAVSVITAGGSLESRLRIERTASGGGAATKWQSVDIPGETRVLVAFEERGIVEGVAVRLQSTAPFGLVGVSRRTVVPLDEALYVAPAAVADRLTDSTMSHDTGDASVGRGLGGEPNGFRLMIPGDRQRDVHWPTVARTGHLMVRDRPSPNQDDDVDVAILVGRDIAVADETIGRARWAIEQLQQMGKKVRLITLESGPEPRSGLVVAAATVANSSSLCRRLAAIRTGSPEEHQRLLAQAGPGLRVTEEGLAWH